MNNNNIEITVNTSQRTQNTQTQVNNQSPTQHSKETASVSQSGRLMQAAGLALGKRAVMDFTSRIGDRTGQRAMQQNINNAMNIASVGANLLIGAKVGGVAGLGIAAAYSGYEAVKYNLDIAQRREEQSMKRDYYRSYAIMANRSNRSGGNL